MRANGIGRAVVEAGDLTLAVTQRGHGPDVVMIPSHGRAGRDFDDLGARLEDAGFRAVALDPRGAGGSSGPLEGVTLHDLAADVALVIEHLCTPPVHVVGHANGQRIARCLAADHPELVDRLVLLACGGRVPGDAEAWALYPDLYEPSLPRERRLLALERNFFAPGTDAAVWLDGWFADARDVQDRANEATPLDDWWRAGEAPVLVIQGLLDVVAPPENGRLLREELGDRVTLVDLPGVGHAILPEAPDRVAGLVIDWLSGGPGPDDDGGRRSVV